MRRLPAAWRFAAGASALAAASGCSLPGFGAPDPKSSEGESIYSLWQGFFLTALAVAALVWGLIVFVILRYRRRSDEIPDQRAYNIPVEVVYTVTPLLIVAVLFGVSVAAQRSVPDSDADPVTRLDVVGLDGGVEGDAQLVAPQLAIALGVEDEVLAQHGADRGRVDRVVEVDGGNYVAADGRVGDERRGVVAGLRPAVDDLRGAVAAPGGERQPAVVDDPLDLLHGQVDGGQGGGVVGLVLAAVLEGDAQVEDLCLAADAQILLGLDFGGQAVAVPAEAAFDAPPALSSGCSMASIVSRTAWSPIAWIASW